MEMWGKDLFDPHFELHIRQAWCTHSMARANLNKSKFFLTSTTKASKYIPKRSRICINWNPSFQIQIYLVNVPLSMNIVKQDLLNNKIVYENFMKCGLKEGISIDGDSWPLRYVIWWRCGSRSQKELTLIQISDIRQKSWGRNAVGIWNPGGGGLIVIYCLIQIREGSPLPPPQNVTERSNDLGIRMRLNNFQLHWEIKIRNVLSKKRNSYNIFFSRNTSP